MSPDALGGVFGGAGTTKLMIIFVVLQRSIFLTFPSYRQSYCQQSDAAHDQRSTTCNAKQCLAQTAKPSATDLRRIYQLTTAEEAEIRLGEFEDKLDAE